MTPDWDKIKIDYITSTISYRALAEKWKVHYTNLAKRAKKENWHQQRQQQHQQTLTKTLTTITQKEVNRATRLQEAADKLLDKLEQAIEQTPVLTPSSVKAITGALKDIKDIQMIKSDADLREQEARIAKLQKEAAREDSGPSKVIVKIEGGEDSWSE